MSLASASVHVWFGAEWAPIREAFEGYLGERGSPVGDERITIAASDRTPANPAGRVARWIDRYLAGDGVIATVVEPRDDFVLRETGNPPLIGVTELLLDPDHVQVDQYYALTLWSRFVPRRRWLRMYISPYLTEDIVTNAEHAHPLLSAQVAEWQGQRVLIASTDLIAAEVIGRALRSVAQPAGDVGLNPWQTEIVRIASERDLGATHGSQIVLELHRAGPSPPFVATEFVAIAQRIAQLVDCTIRSTE